MGMIDGGDSDILHQEGRRHAGGCAFDCPAPSDKREMDFAQDRAVMRNNKDINRRWRETRSFSTDVSKGSNAF